MKLILYQSVNNHVLSMNKQKPRHGRLNGIGGSVKRRGVAFIVNRICVPEFAFMVKNRTFTHIHWESRLSGTFSPDEVLENLVRCKSCFFGDFSSSLKYIIFVIKEYQTNIFFSNLRKK